MFVIETTVLILCVLALCLISLFREVRQYLRQQRQAREVSAALEALHGQPSAEASVRFGVPDEVLDGPSGRKLFIWKPNKQRNVTTITLTIDEEDRVAQGSFRQRSEPRG